MQAHMHVRWAVLSSSSTGCDPFTVVTVLMHRCYLKPRWFLNEDESEKSALGYQTWAQCNRSPPSPLPSPLARAAGPRPFPRGVLPSLPLSRCQQHLCPVLQLHPDTEQGCCSAARASASFFYSIHFLTSHQECYDFWFFNYYLFTQPTINTARHRSRGM